MASNVYTPRTCKIWNAHRDRRKTVSASNLLELKLRGAERLGLPAPTHVTALRVVVEADGTEVEDEAFFRSLLQEGNQEAVVFMILGPDEKWLPGNVQAMQSAIKALPRIVCDAINQLELVDKAPSWKIMDNKGNVTVVLHWDQADRELGSAGGWRIEVTPAGGGGADGNETDGGRSSGGTTTERGRSPYSSGGYSTLRPDQARGSRTRSPLSRSAPASPGTRRSKLKLDTLLNGSTSTGTGPAPVRGSASSMATPAGYDGYTTVRRHSAHQHQQQQHHPVPLRHEYHHARPRSPFDDSDEDDDEALGIPPDQRILMDALGPSAQTAAASRADRQDDAAAHEHHHHHHGHVAAKCDFHCSAMHRVGGEIRINRSRATSPIPDAVPPPGYPMSFPPLYPGPSRATMAAATASLVSGLGLATSASQRRPSDLLMPDLYNGRPVSPMTTTAPQTTSAFHHLPQPYAPSAAATTPTGGSGGGRQQSQQGTGAIPKRKPPAPPPPATSGIGSGPGPGMSYRPPPIVPHVLITTTDQQHHPHQATTGTMSRAMGSRPNVAPPLPPPHQIQRPHVRFSETSQAQIYSTGPMSNGSDEDDESDNRNRRQDDDDDDDEDDDDRALAEDFAEQVQRYTLETQF